jgi:hypothetical protein
MKKKYIITVSIILFILIVGVFAGPVTSYVEKPDYDIIASNENIEIRRYGPMIVAEVEAKGNRENIAGSEFSILALR